ncbi:hypothetical protein DL769_005641 [Monosporascus sp. CRB-8-3]|nr:hypothetical protein DL769_005641 [Monosporascus sp. CRB-8-3]
MASLAQKRSSDDILDVPVRPRKISRTQKRDTRTSMQEVFEIEVKWYSDERIGGDDRSGTSLSDASTARPDDDDFDEDDYEEEGELNEFGEWDWLEAVYGFIYHNASASSEAHQREIGSCTAKMVRRGRMSYNFHDEIEQPTEDLAQMGFTLFDRYGRLKSESKEHPVKKGSGIWGDELDTGDILLIERIYVGKPHRRLGQGRAVVSALLEKARSKSRHFFAITYPAALLTMLSDDVRNTTDQEKDTTYDREKKIAVRFWRAMGFRRIGNSRWFALAGDAVHASHSLAAADDYDPPATAHAALRKGIGSLFGHLEQAEDALCMQKLEEYLRDVPPRPPPLELNGHKGQHAPPPSRCQLKAPTPLEAAMSGLERRRTQFDDGLRVHPVSDRFMGFSDAEVSCLVHLRSLTNPSSLDLQRLKFGCTCGQCIDGFLSPRMLHALLAQAELHYDLMMDEYYIMEDGNFFVEWNDYLTEFPPQPICDNFRTNKSMRQGFANMFDHVATCLRREVLPTKDNVLEVVRSAGEWPPVAKNYLQRGGTVRAVASVVFELAMKEDEWAGDGEFAETFAKEIAPLPRCRNDHEFGFVSGMCGHTRVSAMGPPLDDDD